MVEQGFPSSHNTNTRVSEDLKPNIYLDLSYLRTKPGMLKCAEIVFFLLRFHLLYYCGIWVRIIIPITLIMITFFNLLGFICILSSYLKVFSRGNWFATVSMGGVWFTGIMLVFYVFHVTDKLRVIPWIKIEFCFCLLWTLFYLIAASLVAAYGFDAAFAAAAFFGFIAMVLYGCDAFLKFVELNETAPEQKTATVSTVTTE